jgi:AAA+ ATPase superfamily predicted ATPase
LRFWFRYVEINRSRLGAGLIAVVEEEIGQRLGHHVGEIWEELARASVPLLHPGGKTWGPAGRWWGPGLDRRPLEVDLVAHSNDGRSVLVGEVKWAAPRYAERLLAELEAKAQKLPIAAGREVVSALWLKAPVQGPAAARVITPRQVLDVLR